MVCYNEIVQRDRRKKMKIKIEVSEMTASCLQRMIVGEIENQEWWKSEDKAIGVESDFRDEIIKEMKQLADDIEKRGVKKHIL